MPADLKVVPGPIPEGSIFVLTGFTLRNAEDPFDAETRWGEIQDAIAEVVGHHRFLVLHLPEPGSDLEVWGPDVDLAEKVRELLAARAQPEAKPVRYLTYMGRPTDPKAQAPHIARRHCVDTHRAGRSLCTLPTGWMTRTAEPFSPHAGTGIICSACAGQHLDVLKGHLHNATDDPPCGWCHNCGDYLGTDHTGPCSYCGATDVEG